MCKWWLGGIFCLFSLSTWQKLVIVGAFLAAHSETFAWNLPALHRPPFEEPAWRALRFSVSSKQQRLGWSMLNFGSEFAILVAWDHWNSCLHLQAEQGRTILEQTGRQREIFSRNAEFALRSLWGNDLVRQKWTLKWPLSACFTIWDPTFRAIAILKAEGGNSMKCCNVLHALLELPCLQTCIVKFLGWSLFANWHIW